MPFVQRVVTPNYLSRAILHSEDGKPTINDGELEAVTNYTLSNALKQLASVVLVANEIFEELNKQLKDITERTSKLKSKISAVEEKVAAYDPKQITVPESNLTAFSELKTHYSCKRDTSSGFFTQDSRPPFVQKLYEAAAKTPITILERLNKDGFPSATYFSCTPVLSSKRRRYTVDIDIDIETRTPAALSGLRAWTSSEALGDMTVDPDCTNKISTEDTVDSIEHRLPSPEEQVQAVALKFPAEVVPVDVTGKTFQRMSVQRRSLLLVDGESAVRRRRSRKVRGKRRNTIACTDQKELEAIVYDSSDVNFGKSEDIESSSDRTISEKKSHLDSLKEWGRARLRLIRSVEPAVVKLRERAGSIGRRKWDKEETPYSSSGNWSASSESGHSTSTSHVPRSSISSGSMCPKHGRRPTMVSTSSSVTSESTVTADDGETCSMYSCDTEGYYTSFHLDSGLKTLREEEPVSALHSSSALSGSRCNDSPMTADSEYELFGKGSTSTTASSAGTVCTTLLIPPTPPSVPERKSSQLSSIILPERNVQSLDNLAVTGGKSTEKLERETQSLKIDRKISELSQFICSDNSSNDKDKPSQLTKANVSKLEDIDKDYLKEKGIITVDVHHHNEHLVSEIEGSPEKCGDSPDSGHNTCSSPVDSITSPSVDMEMSECSDLEGLDRIDRINRKTVINSSRIPSMCVITPPQSDDEVSLKQALKPVVDAGDYVTIADVKQPVNFPPVLIKETEYVSLNELNSDAVDSAAEKKRRGARVTLDSEGKVVYSSESLRRRKQIHTTNTFEPGPNVLPNNSPLPHHRAVIANVRPMCPKGSPLSGRIKQALSGTGPVKIDVSKNLDKDFKVNGENFRSSCTQPSQNGPARSNGSIVSLNKNTSTFSSNVGSLTRPVGVKSGTPLILTCSTAQNRGIIVPPGKQIVAQANGKKIVSPNSPNQRPLSPLVSSDPSVRKNIIVYPSKSPNQQVPLGRRDSVHSSRSNSPAMLMSNSRSSSPKTVVKPNPVDQSISPINFKGAYVRMQEPSDCLETCLDDLKTAVKRSDSYRLANDKNANEELSVFNPNSLGRRHRGVSVTAGPNLLVAIKTAHNNQKECESASNTHHSEAPVDSSQISETGTWPRRSKIQSTSTPTKGNSNQLDFSSNLSPIPAPTNQKTVPDCYMPKSFSSDFKPTLNARDRFYNNYLGSLAQMYNSVNRNHFKHAVNSELQKNDSHQSVPSLSTVESNHLAQTQNQIHGRALQNTQDKVDFPKTIRAPPNNIQNQVRSHQTPSNHINLTNHPASILRNRSPSPMSAYQNRAISPANGYQKQVIPASAAYQDCPAAPMNMNILQRRAVSPMNIYQNRPASPMNIPQNYAAVGKQILQNRSASPLNIAQNHIVAGKQVLQNRSASPMSSQRIQTVVGANAYQNRIAPNSRALSPSSQYEAKSFSPPTCYQSRNANNQYSNRALSPSSQYPNHSITPNPSAILPEKIRTERDGLMKISNNHQNINALLDGKSPLYSGETFTGVHRKNNILTERMNAIEANARKDPSIVKTELSVQRPRSVTPTRTGMDLYAVIHESKKRIKALQSSSPPDEISPSHSHSNLNPQIISSKTSFTNHNLDKPNCNDFSGDKIKSVMKSEPIIRTQRSVNDYKPMVEKFGPSSQTSRYDFKKLLLRTGWGSTNRHSEKVSAVERLKNKISPDKQAKESKFSVVDRLRERTPTPRKKQPWKSDVLSSTILEDCAEDEELSKRVNSNDGKDSSNQISEKRLSSYLDKDLTIPKSSALVSQQLKAFSQTSPPSFHSNESSSRKSPSTKSPNRSPTRSPSNKSITLETSL